MISAEEARKISEKNSEINSILKDLEERIEGAASNGSTSLFFRVDSYYENQIINTLLDLGYKAKRDRYIENVDYGVTLLIEW